MCSPPDQLPQPRKGRYDEMLRKDSAKIDPSLLPPSPRAAYYYGLHMYYKIKVWKAFSDADLEPVH